MSRLCGGATRGGGKCELAAGWGTPHPGWGSCKLHSGCTVPGLKSAAKLEAEAAAYRVMGNAIAIEPGDALEFCIAVTRGEVAYCDRRIAELTDADAVVPATSRRRHEELDRDGVVHELRERTSSSEVVLHVWIATRQAAVERLSRYSKMALDAQVAERQVAAAEGWAARLEPVLAAILHGLGLTAEQQRRAPDIIVRELRQLEPAAVMA